MNIQLLELLVKIGKYVSISPSSTREKRERLSKKLYTLGLIVLFTLATLLATIEKKKFYMKLIHLKMVLNSLIDLNLYILQIYIFCLSTIYKKTEWFQLIRNLKTISPLASFHHRIPANKTTKFNYWVLIFLISNLIYVLIATYAFWLWCRTLGFRDNSTQYLVHYVMNYLTNCFYSFFLCNLLWIILDGYRNIHFGLNKQVKHVQKLNKNYNIPNVNFMLFLNKIEIQIITMKETVELFNDIFGWPMFLKIVYSSLQLLNFLDYIFLQKQKAYVDQKYILSIKLSNFSRLFTNFVSYQ